jgi:hypothetical protein
MPDKLVPSNTRPTAPTRASSEREQASKLLKASIHSFSVISRNRTSLESLKSYFHETRRIPCKCRETVATYKASEVLQRKAPKKHKALQSSTSPETVQTQISTISFVSESSAGSLHIACQSVAGATSATTRKFSCYRCWDRAAISDLAEIL